MGVVLPPGGEMEKGHGKWSFSPAAASPHLKEGLDGRGGGCKYTAPHPTPADTQPLHLQPDPQASKVDLGARAV